MSKVPVILADAAATFKGRNSLYGDSYVNFGKVAAELFPQGLKMQTPKDFARLGVMNMIIAKVQRYAANINNGGHKDSAHDLVAYAAMLEELTDEEDKG